jgi:hypothetical protein
MPDLLPGSGKTRNGHCGGETPSETEEETASSVGVRARHVGTPATGEMEGES